MSKKIWIGTKKGKTIAKVVVPKKAGYEA